MSDKPFDFTKISPTDGWYVVAIDRHTYCSLSVELHVGEDKKSFTTDDDTFVTIFERLKPTAADHGNMARLQRLAEALCRYFNSGGCWDDVFALTAAMKFVVGPLDAFAGWHYHDLMVNIDAQYQHIFVSCTEPQMGVVWIEGVAVLPPEPWDKLKDVIYAEPQEEGRDPAPSQAGSSQLQLGHDPT